ncbi:MAG: YkgJ family cysteine cluster protein [Verrucomicrobia bacterium]|nr:YkgJ family cysteine cluster protein [Verrucomicrobiota bacterium]
MSQPATNSTDFVSRLCPNCGLCCNGVLFGDVELQRGDNPKRLTEQGLNLFRKSRKTCFRQPCACFDGKWCQVYADRPNRCRTFECRLLKQVQAGAVTATAALRNIAEARRATEQVRRLVRELGHTDESVPLNRRYAALAAQPIDLATDEERVERRSELMLAVGRLVRILERDFLGQG